MKGWTMEAYLEKLFDYQKFEHNPRVEKMVEDAEDRLAFTPISDEELELVAGGITRETLDAFVANSFDREDRSKRDLDR